MPLADNLIFYCEMEGAASASETDAHGGLTIPQLNGVGSGAGLLGNARQFFSSIHTRLEAANPPALAFGNVPYTIQAWVRFSTLDRGVLVSKYRYTTSDRAYLLLYDQTVSRFTFRVSHNGSASSVATANNFGVPVTGVWYCVHAWHDDVNDMLGISVNGGTANTTSYSLGTEINTAPFNIGGLPDDSGNTLNGLVDEVGIWGRVLTIGERTQLVNSGAGMSYVSILADGGGTPTYQCRPHLLSPGVGPFGIGSGVAF